MKRFVAILLSICLLLGLLPGVAYGAKAEEQEARVLTKQDYIGADAIWEQIAEAEDALVAKRAPAADRSDAIMAIVESSPYYLEGTLSRNGDFFSWETTDGVACGYSPSMRDKLRKAEPLENYESIPTTEVRSFAQKGGSPAKENVYVIQPYYGIDDSFTEQYNNEAADIAANIGGIATTYRTNDATIDKIADAIEDGAVVIFDSHGSTDYESGEDCVSKANTSYICLQSNTGLTTADMTAVQGPFNKYYHAFYLGYYGDMKYYCVDGTAIANHMDRQAPNSLLWMAICLGMATDGMQAPLRKKGVEVVYGYSQSVTFTYDYKWEACFWDEMLKGSTVSYAIATMKQKIGNWDWCHASNYDTLEEARATYSAFPIVVSSEDTYPGHGKVDDYQTVKSTWTLFAACEHNDVEYVPACAPTCTEAGNTAYYRCTECNVCFSESACINQIAQSTTVIPATGHSYDDGVQTVDPTCEEEGVLTYTCTVCGATRTEPVLATGHNYENNYCTYCGQEEPEAVPFEIGHSGEYVIAANVNGVYYAMANAFPEANNKIMGTVITVTDGFVNREDAEGYVVNLQYNSDGTYTIKNDTVYLKYASGTNLTSAAAAYYWKIGTGSKGSWRITSKLSTNRGVFFRTDTYMQFGGYSTANLLTSNSYYDVEILPILSSKCEHVNVREEMTKEATCTEDGEMSVFCADCGELLGTSPVTATGHTYEVTTVAPTCEAVGYETYDCTACDAIYALEIPATGHTTVTDEAVAPTCTATGLTEGSHCSVCNTVFTAQSEVPALGHTYSSEITTIPTCEGAGVKTYTCAVCSDSYTEAIEATGHTTVTDEAVAPTCTATGLTEGSHCSVCNAVITAQTEIPALGHSYVGAETTAPTCEAEGEMTYTCGNCGNTYTEVIAALGHNYVDGSCTNCGAADPSIPAEPTVDESIRIYHTLDLASDISITFAVTKASLASYESYYLECILPEYKGNELVGSSTVEVQPVDKGGYYYFTLTGITAVRMGDMVDAILHMTKADGTEYISTTDVFSVSTYAYNTLNSDKTTAKMMTLCADLLRYGALAQSYKGYRTDALVDAAMTDAQKAYLSDASALTFTETDSKLGDVESPIITWVGKTLNLGSKIGVKFVFNAQNYTGDIANLSVKITYVGSTGETKTAVMDSFDVYSDAAKYYSFTFEGLLASEMRTVLEVAVFEGETQLSETYRYSAETYASKSTTGTLGELCKALFAYSDSAKAYFTK